MAHELTRDPIVLLSTLSAVLSVVNQTLIRKKRRIGWMLGLPNIAVFAYIAAVTGAYGHLLLHAFWAYNAVMGIIEWRTPTEPITTEKELWT